MVYGRECQLLAYPFFTNRPMLALSRMATFTASLVAWGDPVINQRSVLWKQKCMEFPGNLLQRKRSSLPLSCCWYGNGTLNTEFCFF